MGEPADLIADEHVGRRRKRQLGRPHAAVLDAIAETVGLERLPSKLQNRPAVDCDDLGGAGFESEQTEQTRCHSPCR